MDAKNIETLKIWRLVTAGEGCVKVISEELKELRPDLASEVLIKNAKKSENRVYFYDFDKKLPCGYEKDRNNRWNLITSSPYIPPLNVLHTSLTSNGCLNISDIRACASTPLNISDIRACASTPLNISDIRACASTPLNVSVQHPTKVGSDEEILYSDLSEFDFDESSRVWMKNKKKLGNGMYGYVCGAKKRTKSGYCRNEGRKTQSIKKEMRTPGTMSYVYGIKPKYLGEWERCFVHSHIPLNIEQ
jgi:hypothetical protein